MFTELGFDHVEHSRRIILGEGDALPTGERDELGSPGAVHILLEEEGIDPAEVASLL